MTKTKTCIRDVYNMHTFETLRSLTTSLSLRRDTYVGKIKIEFCT